MKNSEAKTQGRELAERHHREAGHRVARIEPEMIYKCRDCEWEARYEPNIREQCDALNLLPGDEVLLDDGWWEVRRHTVDFREAAPVKIELRSTDDPTMVTALISGPSMRFYFMRR